MRIGKILRLAALTFALAIAVTPALVEYADAGRGGGGGGGGMRGHGGGGHHGMRGGGGGRHYGGGGGRHYGGGYRGGRHYGGGGRHYGAVVAIMEAVLAIMAAVSTPVPSITVTVTVTVIIVAATVMVIGAAVFGSRPASSATAPAVIARGSTTTTTAVGCMSANKHTQRAAVSRMGYPMIGKPAPRHRGTPNSFACCNGAGRNLPVRQSAPRLREARLWCLPCSRASSRC